MGLVYVASYINDNVMTVSPKAIDKEMEQAKKMGWW